MAVFNSTDYTAYSESEGVWVKLAALRDAMSQYPRSEWFWFLDQVTLTLTLTQRLTEECNNHESLYTVAYTLSFLCISSRSPSARRPCLPTRDHRSNRQSPQSTCLTNFPNPLPWRRNPTYRINHHSTWRLRGFHTG